MHGMLFLFTAVQAVAELQMQTRYLYNSSAIAILRLCHAHKDTHHILVV